MQQDTIVALATPLGKSAIALIRISGIDSIQITERITANRNLCKKTTHTVQHCNIVSCNGEVIDEVLISIFHAPHSYTKENSVEISCHGSMFIVKKIIERLLLAGARMAAPGEFTKRAYLNGRFDLAQAEAVADVINCENTMSHRMAISQLHGSLSQPFSICRNELIHLASLLALELDFSEEDVEFADRKELLNTSKKILVLIENLLASYSNCVAIKNGISTVLTGAPNVGKSTLLNALLAYDKAIVSSVPGTTRDLIEEVFYLEGIGFRLVDTAGIRNDYGDELEKIGIEKAKKEIEKASIIIEIFECQEANFYSEQKHVKDLLHVRVINKADLLSEHLKKNLEKKGFICVSALKNIGIDKIKEKLIEYASSLHSTSEQLAINSRHYDCLLKAQEGINGIIIGIGNNQVTDILLEEVNFAIKNIEQLTGNITNTEILKNIFSKFCIGK